MAVQNGTANPVENRDLVHRTFLHTPRDLAHYVHFDALYEAYLNAGLILLGLNAPVDQGNPYNFSRNQVGFGTFGAPHLLSLVTEVATRALKAVWYQKWFVHRRLRPEEFGGLVHLQLTGARDFPIDREILDSVVVKRTFERFGSYLLPQAFPEGSPTHPAYGSGHATVAGACVTILKAWFDESFVLADPVMADRDGTALVPYTAPDAGTLTVGGELNKLAANIANARNIAGVHWRTDFSEAVLLGEQVALGVLRELVQSTHEQASFTINLFDGTTVTI
jgi:membrane-associated phospholipid phosphatase